MTAYISISLGWSHDMKIYPHYSPLVSHTLTVVHAHTCQTHFANNTWMLDTFSLLFSPRSELPYEDISKSVCDYWYRNEAHWKYFRREQQSWYCIFNISSFCVSIWSILVVIMHNSTCVNRNSSYTCHITNQNCRCHYQYTLFLAAIFCDTFYTSCKYRLPQMILSKNAN